MQAAQIQSERLFLSSVASPYTRNSYKFYLQKYLQICGYEDVTQLLTQDTKHIENEIIEFIITSKEKGMKRAAISNYTKPVIAICSISDKFLNTKKINKVMPPRTNTRNKKTSAYSAEQIQKLLDITDERMRVVVLLASSCGLRVGSIPGLSVGSLEEVKDLYRITVYENEPEMYIVYCTNECRRAISEYLKFRERFGEVITKASPLIREQFDKRDQFSIANPRRIKEDVLMKKLTEMAEAAGLRTRTHLKEGQKPGSQTKEIPVCNGFRRFYSSALVNSGLITEKRRLLEGHSLHGNDASYVHIDPNDLLEQFEKAHDNLLIDQSHKLREKIAKLEVERDSFEMIRAKIAALEQKVNST